jgi:inorganic pyrophosphatase
MTDKGMNDYKILAVPSTDPIFADFRDLFRVPSHFLREVEHFFATYKQLETKEPSVRTLGWEGCSAAHDEILGCITRFKKSAKGKKLIGHGRAKKKR